MMPNSLTVAGKSVFSQNRPAIALMVTLFFIMAITVAVGLSLTQLKKGNLQLQEGRFLVQGSAVIEDVLSLLNNSTEVIKVEDAATLRLFLDSAAFIPFEVDDLRVKITMRSARSRLNINLLGSSEALQEALKTYLISYNIQDVSYFVDLLLDCMSGTQELYKTEIFDEQPWMYRDRIVDRSHFDQLLDFYVKMRHDNSIRNVVWEKIISFGDPKRSQIDANYATPELWRLMLPDAGEEQANTLAEAGLEGYESEDDLNLSDKEREQIAPFGIAYYLPVAEVKVIIEEYDKMAEIVFQYDIASKQAKEFSYDI